MDEMKTVWGFGIPQFDEDDLLEGMELQSYCTQETVKSLKEEEMSVDEVYADSVPPIILTSKDNEKYAVMVAGDAVPNVGRVSVILKKRFADYWISKGYEPVFAPVGLCSTDMARMNESLLLKGDDFFFRYDGVTELKNMKEPKVGDEEYAGYIMELFIDAYRNNSFENIYSRIADNAEFYALNSNNPVRGRDEVCEYLEGIAKKNEKSGTKYDGTVCIIVSETAKCKEIGKICPVLMKQNGQQVSWLFADTDLDENGKIKSVKIEDSAQYAFRTYYNFE